MAEILKGAPVTAALNEKMTAEVAALKEKGVVPTLAILRVGERPDDLSYETGLVKRCDKADIPVRMFLLPEDCTKAQLLDTVRQIHEDASIHGCLMFRPPAR
jgi:methylenetetrahydrofolate dehydrogenase (NADP+)/methenyltetrahydrofolate cyclohydrolase